MKLQYQLSNGNYVDVPDGREKYFLAAALKHDQKFPDTYRGKRGFATIDDVIAALESGEELRRGTDWYDYIRDGEAHQRKLAAAKQQRDNDPNYSNDGWKLDCGCTVYWRSHIMSTSSGTSCTDCYDRMSN